MIDIKLPEQHVGSQTDNSDYKEYSTSSEAKENFNNIKRQFLDINNWHNVSDGISSEFIVVDSKGNDKNTPPQLNDYIKIKIPVPGPIEGDGFDWVKIVDFQEGYDSERDYDYLYFTLRPTKNPNGDEDLTAHFYTDESTNTFILLREKEKITIGVHGRNEVPNKSQSEGLDKIRNQGLAIGAMFGLANPQWKNLIHGLLK